jgi:Putative restriction endonuclease
MTWGARAEPTAVRRLSLAEWERLPEDDTGELVRGVVVEADEEAPSYVHEAAVVWLMGTLLPWCRGNEARVVGSGLKYALGGDTGRMPDLSVFLRGADVDALWRELEQAVAEGS